MTALTRDGATAAPPSGRSGGLLAAGRAVEQAGYGVAMLVLAARMQVDAYGAVAALFVVNSVALTLADLGVAHDILRTEPDRPYPSGPVRRQRWVNASAAAVAVACGAIVGGRWGVVVAAGGLLWVLGGEAYLRQAVALRTGRVRAHVVVDAVSAVVLVAVVVVGGSATAGLAAAVVGLVAHHLVICVALRIPVGTFGGDGTGAPWRFLANHSLAFGTRNADYVLAGPLLGPAFFSAYVLGFRVASAPAAPAGPVVLRWGLARLSGETAEQRAVTNRRTVDLLVAVGLAASVATVAVALVLPSVIGERWRDASAVAVVLALAMPWRFVEGMVGAVGFTHGAGPLLGRFETVRLVGTVVALLVGAVWGPAGFVAAGVIATVFSVTVGHVLVCRTAELPVSRLLLVSAPLVVLAAPVLAALVVGSSVGA